MFRGSVKNLPIHHTRRPIFLRTFGIRTLIDAAQNRVAQAVNAELVLLYWQIGARIRHDVLRQSRAEYGEKIVSTLSRRLIASYGFGFSRQNLFHMIRFVEAWPDHEQVARLAANVGWSHFKEILYLENEMQRQYGTVSSLAG